MSVEIIVRGKNIEISPALKDYAEKKLRKVEKYLRQSPLSCHATFSTQRDNYVLEVTAPLNGYLLRAEESSRDALAAVDLVMDKLEKQIERYRTRLRKRDKAEPSLQHHEQTPEGGKIVRVKRFPIKPMPPEEATMQMELLGHGFFVFLNADTGSVNVVYKRRDGDYGLIEPEE